MRENFDRCLALLLVHEGGYVDHPDDPGGATLNGVIQSTYDDWRRSQGLPTRPVRQMQPAERDAIYRTRYWRPSGGEETPMGIDYVAFDGSTHAGVSQGLKWLQRALKVTADGKFGPVTLAAALGADAVATIKDAIRRRMSFLQALKHWKTFAKGWTRRVAEVEADAIAMAAESADQARRRAAQEAQAAKKAQKGQEAGGAVSGTAGAGSGVGAGEVAEAHQPEQPIDPDPSAVPEWLWPWILGGAAVALICLAIWLFYRSRVNKARAKAHAAVAARKGVAHA